MDNTKKKLTFFEATSIITGYGIGGGVMAVPYLASRNGVFPALLIMAAAFAVSILLHLMIAEICSGKNEPRQILEIFRKYIFKGKHANVLTWFFFGLILTTMLANLAAYVSGAGEILTNLTGMPLMFSQIIFYLISAGIVFFGLKVLGISEKIAVLGIVIILTVLTIASFNVPFNNLPMKPGSPNAALAFFGMIMFSFAAFFSVPQAVEGLQGDTRKIKLSVICGIGINLVFILVITFISLLVSQEVTEVAIIGWSAAVGGWANILGSIFILLAMVTTYWSISFALAVIVKERISTGTRLSWLIATLPSLVPVLLGMSDFLGFMRMAGGSIAILIAVLVIPTYRASRKAHIWEFDYKMTLGLFGTAPFQILVVIGYLLMMVGSIIPLE